jgi:hypothetical protein
MDVPAPQPLPGLPADTLKGIASISRVPQDRLEHFAGHLQVAFVAAEHMALSENRRHPLLPSGTQMRALAKALRRAVAALEMLGEAEAFALLGRREHEPQHAVGELAAYLADLAETADAEAKPLGRPAKTRRIVAGDDLARQGRTLSASEYLTFELYRAAYLNGGKLGRDKQRRSGTMLRAWGLIVPHTALRPPSPSRISELITAAINDAERTRASGEYPA